VPDKLLPSKIDCLKKRWLNCMLTFKVVEEADGGGGGEGGGEGNIRGEGLRI
jgi:hypothetical protein